MRILVTGSSGWLGQMLVPRLRRDGHHVVGLDVRPGAHTSIVGSIVERAMIEDVMSAEAITAVVHCAALHKPDIARPCEEKWKVRKRRR
jgi:UDP-glucose 4-epimerase